MPKKTKFKPDWKFKVGTYIIMPPKVIFAAGPGTNGLTSQEFVGRVAHYNIYNRNNCKYVCKCLKTGEFKDLDKKFVEDTAKIVDNKVANVLYNKD